MSLNKIDLTWLDRTAVKYLGIDSEISRALILYAPRAYFLPFVARSEPWERDSVVQ